MGFLDHLKNTVDTCASSTAEHSATTSANDGLVNAECVRVSVCMPADLTTFKTMDGADFKNPYKVAALTVVALCLYPVNAPLSIELLNYLKGPKPLSAYEVQFLKDRFRGKDYLAASYLDGATPENNYEPKEPYAVHVYKTSHSEDLLQEGYLQLFLKSGGADSARGVKLRKKESTGEWFLWEYLLLPDIRKPICADPWA